MGRRGPPPKPADVVALRGTGRKDRARGELGTDADGYIPELPRWFKANQRKIWIAKCNEYRRRGQRVQGFESSLAIYVALEAEITDAIRKGIPVQAAKLTQYKAWAVQFYDTPAAAVEGSTSKPDGDNPFADRGKR